MTHIETITKGSSQRIRRTTGYRVVSDRKTIAQFDYNTHPNMEAALVAAQKALAAYLAGAPMPDAADDLSTIIRTPDACARVAWPQG